jgi:hypothetical protein
MMRYNAADLRTEARRMEVFGFFVLECHISYPAKAICRAMLASGQLGSHKGLPVTMVVSRRWSS